MRLFLAPAAPNPKQPTQTDRKVIELLDNRGLTPAHTPKPPKPRAKKEDNVG